LEGASDRMRLEARRDSVADCAAERRGESVADGTLQLFLYLLREVGDVLRDFAGRGQLGCNRLLAEERVLHRLGEEIRAQTAQRIVLYDVPDDRVLRRDAWEP